MTESEKIEKDCLPC